MPGLTRVTQGCLPFPPDDSPHWVYLIHFDRPIFHSRHYLGCTSSLRARLLRHALGNGANLLRVARHRDIEWTVARIWRAGFDVERNLKDLKNMPRYCPMCTKAPYDHKSLADLPLELLTFPLTSKEIRHGGITAKHTLDGVRANALED